MFNWQHFIWLGISLLIIVGHIVINKIFKLSYKTNLLALFAVCIVSELFKIMVNMETKVGIDFESSGTYLTYESLPFHLCSIQIFFVISLMFFIKSDAVKYRVLNFMFPTMCVGAAMALFIPTEGTSFTTPIVYQYYIYHAYIIGFAIYLVMSGTIQVTFKVMFRNIAYLFALSIMAIYINGMFSFANVNFMFVARPPLDNLPILNLNHGWYVYFLSIVIIGVVFMILFHLPFALATRKENKSKVNE